VDANPAEEVPVWCGVIVAATKCIQIVTKAVQAVTGIVYARK
jgi:hypothetical protein